MRTILPLLLFLIATTALVAEPPEEDILRPRIPTTGSFFVGFDVGLNTTWFDGNPIYRAFFNSEEESQFFRSAFGFEPFGGLYMGLKVTPNVAIRLRGDYDVRIADRKGTSVDSCPLHDAVTGEIIGALPVNVEKEYTLEIAYATLSLVGEYHMGKVFLFLGPSYSIPLKRTFRETDRILDEGSVCIYFGDTPDTSREISAEVTGTDNVSSVLGLKLGAGYSIEMGPNLSLVPQLGFDFPFTSALVEDEDFAFRSTTPGAERSITTRLNRNMFFRALQASIGLRYTF